MPLLEFQKESRKEEIIKKLKEFIQFLKDEGIKSWTLEESSRESFEEVLELTLFFSKSIGVHVPPYKGRETQRS